MRFFSLFIALILTCFSACRLVGPDAEAHFGITAEDVYAKMIETIDPEGDLSDMEVCVMEREVIEKRENILGKVTEHFSTVVTTVRPPDCVNMTTSYGQGNYKSLIMNKDGAWKRDLAGKVTQLTGKKLLAAQFMLKKIMISGVKQRHLWEKIVLEESDINPEKWYRLVLYPKDKDVDPEVNYVNRESFLLDRVVASVPAGENLQRDVSVICDIEAYKSFEGVMVPSLIRYSGEEGVVIPTEIRLKRFELDKQNVKCECSFDPYKDEGATSIHCELHSPLTPPKNP